MAQVLGKKKKLSLGLLDYIMIKREIGFSFSSFVISLQLVDKVLRKPVFL